jgi:hypothetical protein
MFRAANRATPGSYFTPRVNPESVCRGRNGISLNLKLKPSRLSEPPSPCRLLTEPRRRQRVHVHRRLLSRHPEISLADDIVAIEHASGHVPGHRHGDALGDSRACNIPSRCMAQAVEEPSGTPAAWPRRDEEGVPTAR